MSSCSTPACPPTNVKFQLRRATAIEWTTRNPALRAGEPGVETDTGQMKIGNETCDRWNDLPYVGFSDLEAIRNLALNAFIWDARIIATYDPANLRIIADTTFYGNSSYYDVTYTLSPSSIAPNTTSRFINNSSTIFNNLEPNAAPGTTGNNTLRRNIPITNLVLGDNTLTLDITTQNAGGLGRFSSKRIQTTLTLGINDPMGNPIIAIDSTPTITTNTVPISGILYYSNGTIINFVQNSVTFNNIYNNIQFPNLPFNFLTVNDTSGSSTTLQNTTILYYSSPPINFPAPVGTNSTYNNYVFSYTLNGPVFTSPDILTLTAVNAKLLSGNTRYRGRSGKTSIGYIGTGWNSLFEVVIPLNQNTPTISGITEIRRMSISNSSSNAITPLITHIIPFNNSTLTNFDSFYLPYQSRFCSNLNISNEFALIDMPNQTIPSSPGVRYLTLRITNTAVLRAFTIILGTGSRSPNVLSLNIMWFDSINNRYYGWYDSNIPYINPGGCQNGVSGLPYVFQININVSDMPSYNLAAGGGGGNIWINIRYSGSININDINII